MSSGVARNRHPAVLENGIPESAISLIERSREAEPPSLYGRFDLLYDGCHPPKLFKYDADTIHCARRLWCSGTGSRTGRSRQELASSLAWGIIVNIIRIVATS
jgi:hypothetical protein